jgi:hypothetical protein
MPGKGQYSFLLPFMVPCARLLIFPLSSIYPRQGVFMQRDRHTHDILVSDADGRLRPVFGSRHYIPVPREVEVVQNGELCLRYSVPPHWPEQITTEDHYWGDLVEDRYYADAEGNPIVEERWGKEPRTDTSDLLNDFLKLAPDPDAELTQEFLEAAAAKVKKFAERWGPLWKCITPEHQGFYWAEGCYWPSPLYWDYRPGGKPCSWRPVEEVSAFLRRSQQANALIRAFQDSAQVGYLIPKKWRHFLTFPHRANDFRDPAKQRALAAGSINLNLRSLSSPYIEFTFTQQGAPKLEISTGLGFFPAVWFEIAQSLCSAHGLAQCDGCGRHYVRHGRKPKGGQRNFCPDCRENDRGSKRVYAQQKRREDPIHKG